MCIPSVKEVRNTAPREAMWIYGLGHHMGAQLCPGHLELCAAWQGSCWGSARRIIGHEAAHRKRAKSSHDLPVVRWAQ